MAWAKNGTPHTLTGTADEIQISDLDSKKFNKIIYHIISSGSARKKLNFNNDGIAGSSYAYRKSANGGSDTTSTSAGYIELWNNQTEDMFGIVYTFVDSSEEKLSIIFNIGQNASGAGNAPNRREVVGKEVTNDALTQVDIDNDSTGDFAADSNLSAIGTD